MLNSMSGFTLLNDGGYKSNRRLGQIIGINYGYETDYLLAITMQCADEERTLTFRNPLAYRVQDEGDLLHYWSVRDKEGIAVGVLYTVNHSPYRSEFRATISAQVYSFQHYVVAGDDICVEVLTTQPPQLPMDWSV